MDVSLKDASAFSEFLRALLARVHVQSEGEIGALFSVAYLLSEAEEPYFLTGRCVFEHKSVPPRRDEYRELMFDEWWTTTDEAAKIVAGLVGGDPTLDGVRVPLFYVPSARHRIGQRSSITGWPEWLFEMNVNRQQRKGPSSDPVVRPGLRPYGSAAQAITDWVWRAPTKEASNVPRENQLVVVVPDYRARINSAEWRARTVIADVDGSEPGLELQALVLAGGTHQPLPAISNPPFTAATTLEVPTGTERVELFLVRQNGELADHVVLHGAGEEFEAIAGEPTPEEQALTDLRAGEGQEIEFKPFIAPNEPKEDELVRTVVAFANTDGGRLYIGVKDTGAPEGEAVLCKMAKSDAIPGWKILADRVLHLVREKVKPTADVSVLQIRVFGDPIIVVKIAASSGGPFSTHENDVWVRKGATNRKPDPRTELPHIGSSQRAAFLTGLRGEF